MQIRAVATVLALSSPSIQGKLKFYPHRFSLEAVSLERIENLKLPQLTVLIGANGVGKSSFIHFFEMLGWMLRAKNLQEFVLHKGGGDDQFFMGSRRTPLIKAELSIATEKGTNDYQFEMAHLSAGDTVMLTHEAYRFSDASTFTKANWIRIANIGKESMLAGQANTTAKTIFHLLRQYATYQFHDTSDNASLHQRWDTSDSVRLRSDGGNLAAVLLELRENHAPRYKQLVQLEADILEKVKAYTNRFDPRFVLPYVQMHEFEGLLFSDTEQFREVLDGWTEDRGRALMAVKEAFSTPGEIMGRWLQTRLASGQTS